MKRLFDKLLRREREEEYANDVREALRPREPGYNRHEAIPVRLLKVCHACELVFRAPDTCPRCGTTGVVVRLLVSREGREP